MVTEFPVGHHRNMIIPSVQISRQPIAAIRGTTIRCKPSRRSFRNLLRRVQLQLGTELGPQMPHHGQCLHIGIPTDSGKFFTVYVQVLLCHNTHAITVAAAVCGRRPVQVNRTGRGCVAGFVDDHVLVGDIVEVFPLVGATGVVSVDLLIDDDTFGVAVQLFDALLDEALFHDDPFAALADVVAADLGLR